MKITATNQDKPSTAQVNVVVGCGLDGDEGNEPSFTYTINADGLKIYHESGDGDPQGSVDLSWADVSALCGSPLSEPGPALEAAAVNIVEQKLRTRIFSGDEAEAQLKQSLAYVWKADIVGKAWVLSKHRPGWSELRYQDFATAETSDMVVVDYAPVDDPDHATKYTYHPGSRLGVLTGF